IVATNTSALPVSELADVTVSPEHVIGMHFFNPVSRMKLVEVVIAKQTSDETRERSLAFARQIGKLPVVVRDSPGFLVNRVLFPYLLDAVELFEKGISADKIDHALVEWGMPMGPLRLIDEIGVDVTVDIANTLEKKVVEAPEDADYGMILATGFAPFRGGPLRFAEHFGLKKLVDEMERLAQTEKKFAPCEILKKHARDGTRFYES